MSISSEGLHSLVYGIYYTWRHFHLVAVVDITYCELFPFCCLVSSLIPLAVQQWIVRYNVFAYSLGA